MRRLLVCWTRAAACRSKGAGVAPPNQPSSVRLDGRSLGLAPRALVRGCEAGTQVGALRTLSVRPLQKCNRLVRLMPGDERVCNQNRELDALDREQFAYLLDEHGARRVVVSGEVFDGLKLGQECALGGIEHAPSASALRVR